MTMVGEESPPRTALVLCGGGTGGAVEVGLFRAVVELGIAIDFILASSIGAVNGTLIAAGLTPAQLEGHWRVIRTRDVVGPRWQFLRMLTGAPSLFDNHCLRELLQGLIPVRLFCELRIPLYIVATDLETSETVVLTEGDLIEAILASTALPGLFPQVQWQGRPLIDGGLSNNLPIDLAIQRGAGRVIGTLCGCAKKLSNRPTLVSVLSQSFAVALNARLRRDLELYESQVDLHILEPCPGRALELLDFDHAWTLIEPAYQHAVRELQRRLA